MLHQFLQELAGGDSRSLADIAQSMEISPSMAARIAEDLARLGYLEPMGSGCSSHEETCKDCPVPSNCNQPDRAWFLTEKGKSVLIKTPLTQFD
jgi:hypothetical protein